MTADDRSSGTREIRLRILFAEVLASAGVGDGDALVGRALTSAGLDVPPPREPELGDFIARHLLAEVERAAGADVAFLLGARLRPILETYERGMAAADERRPTRPDLAPATRKR